METTNVRPSLASRVEFWLVIITFVIFLGGFWIVLNRISEQSNPGELEPAPVVGRLAPEIALVSLSGESLQLSDFRGQPVIINFWATWCAPCRAETPELQDLHRERGDEVIIFSVNATAQDQGDIAGFVEEFGVTFPVVLDTEAVAFKDYNVIGLPTTIFVNAEGVINEIFTGPVNRAYMESKIAELL